jgi:type I restriction enzyme, S subunit
VTKGWEEVRFGDVCELVKGRKPRLRERPATGDQPYLVAKVLRGAPPAQYAPPSDRNAVSVEADETIIICDGSNSGETFHGFGGILSSTMAKLRINRNGVDSGYLRLFLLMVVDDLRAGKVGAAIPHLDRDALNDMRLPIPPLPEQRRLVSILDEAFEGIAAAKANAEHRLRNSSRLFESYCEQLLRCEPEGWQEKPLRDLCEIRHGFAFKSKYFASDGEYVCLTPGNFFESGGYRDRGEKTKYYAGPIPDGFVLSPGQMLLAMTEQAPGLLGSPMIVPDSQRFLHNQRLGLVCPKPGVPWKSDFFFHVFNRPHFRSAVHASATGVKVRHTSPAKLGDVTVMFPTSAARQQQIANALLAFNSNTEAVAEICVRRSIALDELKASLLHQAFTGAL